MLRKQKTSRKFACLPAGRASTCFSKLENSSRKGERNQNYGLVEAVEENGESGGSVSDCRVKSKREEFEIGFAGQKYRV